MLLFRSEHVTPILMGVKTQTRRIWKRCRVKTGHIYQAKTGYRSGTFAFLRIKRVWKERLLDISDADARAEGYVSREAFLKAFMRINRLSEIPEGQVVWAIEFELAERHTYEAVSRSTH
jgi:hypothetical protein